jgi:hypothetical protein
LKSQLVVAEQVDHLEVEHQVEPTARAYQGIQAAEAETLVQDHIQVQAVVAVVPQ